MKKRIKLLSLDNPELNKRLIDLFAPEGSKARDFLDIEMKIASEDLELKREIKESPEKYMFEFVDYVRGYLKKDKKLDAIAKVQVEDWVKNFQGSDSFEEVKYAS